MKACARMSLSVVIVWCAHNVFSSSSLREFAMGRRRDQRRQEQYNQKLLKHQRRQEQYNQSGVLRNYARPAVDGDAAIARHSQPVVARASHSAAQPPDIGPLGPGRASDVADIAYFFHFAPSALPTFMFLRRHALRGDLPRMRLAANGRFEWAMPRMRCWQNSLEDHWDDDTRLVWKVLVAMLSDIADDCTNDTVACVKPPCEAVACVEPPCHTVACVEPPRDVPNNGTKNKLIFTSQLSTATKQLQTDGTMNKWRPSLRPIALMTETTESSYCTVATLRSPTDGSMHTWKPTAPTSISTALKYLCRPFQLPPRSIPMYLYMHLKNQHVRAR